MKPVEFEEQNIIMIEPEGWTQEQCGRMGVFADPEGSMGVGEIISCWEITDEEIEKLKETKKVWLMMMTKHMPPSTLTVDYPFAKPEDKNDEPIISIDLEDL